MAAWQGEEGGDGDRGGGWGRGRKEELFVLATAQTSLFPSLSCRLWASEEIDGSGQP